MAPSLFHDSLNSCQALNPSNILAHRANLRGPDSGNQNSMRAFTAISQVGFGLETDFRDATGALVISHDPATHSAIPAPDFFGVWSNANSNAPLAINVKSDGLWPLLKPLLSQNSIVNYFCFDMSTPETLAYRRASLRYFTRESEYEQHPVCYEDAAGVWMDMFHSDWITPDHVARHIDAGKHVAIVSPDLHRRPHEPFWIRLRETGAMLFPNVMLCTDYPLDANAFFYA